MLKKKKNGRIPAYTIPNMAQVRRLEKKNGFVVASFFSGCGGSSLGYRMAGFDVRYANEFWGYAADTYEANSTIKVDRRSIVDVDVENVLSTCGVKAGELDVLDGSPPCQTFSTAGSRNMRDERTDLFFQWLWILNGVRPRAFVAENVSGMVKGVAKGQFKRVLSEMRALGYNVSAKLLDAQWLGVPQQRQRIIFIGIREDLGLDPVHPKPLTYRYSVTDACPWMLRTREETGGSFGKGEYVGPAPTIRKSGVGQQQCVIDADYILQVSNSDRRAIDGTSNYKIKKVCKLTKPSASIEKPMNKYPPKHSNMQDGTEAVYRKFTIAEVRRICSFPDDFKQEGSYANQWGVLGNSVPPLMMRAIAKEVAKTLRKTV